MGRQKGFARVRPDLGIAQPLDRLDSIITTEPRLEILLTEMVKHGLLQEYRDMIIRLAELTPTARLVVNLKTCLTLMAATGVENVLRDGLTPIEYKTLTAIDSSGITTESRRTAHSLMDIEARITLVSVFRGLFRDMRTRKQHMLERRPLDN